MDKLLKFLRDWLHKQWPEFPFSRGSSQFRDWIPALQEFRSPALQADSLPSEPQKRFLYAFYMCACVCVCVCVCVQLLQSHLTLCNPMHCSLPDSSVHRIFPERTLEWVVISSSRGILLTQGSNLCLLHLLHCRLSHCESQPTTQSRKIDYCL